MNKVTASKIMVAYTDYLKYCKEMNHNTTAENFISKAYIIGRGNVLNLWNKENEKEVINMIWKLVKHGYFEVNKQELNSGYSYTQAINRSWEENCFRITEKGKEKVRELYNK